LNKFSAIFCCSGEASLKAPAIFLYFSETRSRKVQAQEVTASVHFVNRSFTISLFQAIAVPHKNHTRNHFFPPNNNQIIQSSIQIQNHFLILSPMVQTGS
jgi:hypothetical protein